MDFKPVCLRVTFCDIKLLVSISPFKTISDLKKEVSRVYRLHYPQKTEECKYVQDSSGYLVCDDYQIGLIFSSSDSVFGLTATQPLDKYIDQWKNSEFSSGHFGAAGDQSVVAKQSHVEPVNASKMMSTPVLIEGTKHLNEQESDGASETDCSNELIPQILEGNQTLPKTVSTRDAQQVNSPSVSAKNLQNKKELNKKESSIFTDSSLSDSDSEASPSKIIAPTKGGSKGMKDGAKLTPKKGSVKKTAQEQNVFDPTASAGDKSKDSVKKSLGQKFQLAPNTNDSTPQTATKKLRTKRKHPSEDSQGILSSEKKSKKKISKRELELANTSSQSMILDNAKLWTES